VSTPAPALELRNAQTIRAYLEELVRLQGEVQLWLPGGEAAPFPTTLQKVTPTTFTTVTTPPLEPRVVINFSFMLDARRFTGRAQVVTPGVFRIPPCIAQGERRCTFRGAFERAEQVQVLAVETCAGTLLGGRILLGRLANLCAQGLGLVLEELGALDGAAAPLQPGDRFAAVRISNLPFTPTIQCRGTVVHVAPATPEPVVGFRLEGLSDRDAGNIERLLIPRFPTTFGEAFPDRKRKTDLADQPGPPTSSQVRVKAPEVVDHALAGPAPVPAPARPQPSAVQRLRRAPKRILFFSAHPATPALADALRKDGLRQVAEAGSYQQAKVLAEQGRFDLLVLDVKVGSHWAKDHLRALGEHGLLQGLPTILMVDHPREAQSAMARPLAPAWVHERAQGADDLLAAACALLGVD
jgi:CheY-like chemotaxis protein